MVNQEQGGMCAAVVSRHLILFRVSGSAGPGGFRIGPSFLDIIFSPLRQEHQRCNNCQFKYKSNALVVTVRL